MIRLFNVSKRYDGVAAVVLEPVQGEGGVHAADPEFLRAARAACDDAVPRSRRTRASTALRPRRDGAASHGDGAAPCGPTRRRLG